MNDFPMAISQQDDNSIMELEILGHGSHNMINIEPGENGAGLIWEPSVTGDSVWMSDKGDKFSDLIRDKLAKNAMIDLNGCNTGRICKWVKNIWYIKRFYVEKNIAQQLSEELCDTTILSNRGLAIANELSYWFDRDYFIRLGMKNRVYGFRRKYFNGVQK